MANGQWLKAVKVKGLENLEPLLILINQTIVLRAEAWECGACATTDDWVTDVVAALGRNSVNIHLRSSIAQNISFHNVFEI